VDRNVDPYVVSTHQRPVRALAFDRQRARWDQPHMGSDADDDDEELVLAPNFSFGKRRTAVGNHALDRQPPRWRLADDDTDGEEGNVLDLEPVDNRHRRTANVAHMGKSAPRWSPPRDAVRHGSEDGTCTAVLVCTARVDAAVVGCASLLAAELILDPRSTVLNNRPRTRVLVDMKRTSGRAGGGGDGERGVAADAGDEELVIDVATAAAAVARRAPSAAFSRGDRMPQARGSVSGAESALVQASGDALVLDVARADAALRKRTPGGAIGERRGGAAGTKVAATASEAEAGVVDGDVVVLDAARGDALLRRRALGGVTMGKATGRDAGRRRPAAGVGVDGPSESTAGPPGGTLVLDVASPWCDSCHVCGFPPST
jgi:hypothetical protein